jgi:Fe2+ or Zn2+ uptake regulation protein
MASTADARPLFDEVASRLARVGQRFTPGRRALVEALEAAPRPLTLPELLEADSRLTQSSTYRNLYLLEEVGIVRRLTQGPAEHAAFELAEEFSTHHHHLICRECGAVTDITLSDEAEDEIERALARAAAAHDFEAQHHALDLFGRCGSCA